MRRLTSICTFLIAALLALASPLRAQAMDTTVVCRACVPYDSVGTVTHDTVYTAFRDSLEIRPAAPVGFALVTRNDFNTAILAAGWKAQNNNTSQYALENDPSVSRDGSPYLKLVVPAGHPAGSGFLNLTYTFADGQCREIAYSVWVRLTRSAPYGSNVQKLLHWWGPTGDGRGTGGIGNVGLTNLYITPSGYAVRAAFQSVEPTNTRGISNQTTGGSFAPDTWVKLEGRLAFNSVDTPAGADGYHRIDRTSPLAVAHVNAENIFWTADVPIAKRFWRWLDIDPTTPSAVNPATYVIYFDDLAVSCR